MKKIISFFVFILLVSSIFAQRPQGNGAAGGKFKMPAIGRLYGKVVEKESKQNVEYASVALYSMRDSLISGVLTQGNGDFSLEQLPFGKFKVKINFLGFKSLIVPVLINQENVEQDLGDLRLETDAKALQEVTVTSEKSVVQMNIDRKVFNVDKNLHSAGGTAEDVMKTIPSVSVDVDGKVSLRNNSTTIFIDGKPTQMSLNQIPADQIEQVEVITNPSAKFDADATGGILNLVMKKNRKPGYNGSVSSSYGTGGRYGGMINLNLKQNPFNLSLSLNTNKDFNSNVKGFTNRYDLTNRLFFEQDNLSDGVHQRTFGRASLEYAVNNRNTLTLAANGMGGRFEFNELQTSTEYPSFQYSNRTVETRNRWGHNTVQGTWKKLYPKKGKELVFDAQYNFGKPQNSSYYITNTYLLQSSLTASDVAKQHNYGGASNQQYVGQIDFTNPLNDSTKLEVGVKTTHRNNLSPALVDTFDFVQNAYLPFYALSTEFRIKEMINAAYINYASRLPHNWGYQAGVRIEQMIFDGVSSRNEENLSYSYPDKTGKNWTKAIFPSLFLTKKIKTGQEIQINFSRKINRPGHMQIMPIRMFMDKLNYRVGNPGVRPEFINLAELNYNNIFKGNNWLSTVYLRDITDPIVPFTRPSPDNINGGNNSIKTVDNTFINGKRSTVVGLDNTLKLNFIKNLEMTTNLNVFQTQISTNDYTNQGLAYNFKENIQYKLPKDFALQLSGTYESPRVIPQGRVEPMYFMDISLRKDILKFASLTLQGSDVFNTRRMAQHIVTGSFIQDSSRRREIRFVKLTAMVRFGKMDATFFKKAKSTKRDAPEGGGGMDF